jgi:hypothetical protein
MCYKPDPDRSSVSRRISLINKGTFGPKSSSVSSGISHNVSYQIY